MKGLRILLAIPCFNEEILLPRVLESLYSWIDSEILKDPINVLVFNDGSTDSSSLIIEENTKKWRGKLLTETHEKPLGYGRTISDILRFACSQKDKFDIVITFDADLQHDPVTIPSIIDKLRNRNIDVVSGSRYLDSGLVSQRSPTPHDRFLVNMGVTFLLNTIYSLGLTDSFSGFRGYRTCKIEEMFRVREAGYSSPIEFWINASYHRLAVTEVPTPLIYLEGRESKGNERPWKARISDYLGAFRKYAWSDEERGLIDGAEPEVLKFIEMGLLAGEVSGKYEIADYNTFWHRNDDQSQILLGNRVRDRSIMDRLYTR